MSDKDAYPILDLFAGYGGFSLAFEAVAHAVRPGGSEVPGSPYADEGQYAGRAALDHYLADRDGQAPAFRTIGFSEIDPYASAILAHRWPTVPNLGDVRDITADSVLRRCGVLPVVVTGGFPCQPHSHAGKRQASLDERDLWDECARVLRDLRPRFALFENVAGLLSSESGLFFNRVLSDLAEIGYGCQWETLSAAAIGAPHRRERIWLLCWDERGGTGRVAAGMADRHGEGLQGSVSPRVDDSQRRQEQGMGHAGSSGGDGLGLADTDGQRGDEDSKPGQLWAGWPLESPGDCGPADPSEGDQGPEGATGFWPAAHGLWPARPGEPQWPWEPSRVVGGLADTQRVEGQSHFGQSGRCGSEPGTGTADGVGLQGSAGGEVVGNAASHGDRNGPERAGGIGVDFAGEVNPSWQAQPELGGDADGPPAGAHAAPAEVREVEISYADEREADEIESAEGGEWIHVSDLTEEEIAAIEAKEEEGVVGVTDAVNRTHRLKALGNGIVPLCALPFAMAIYRMLEEG